MTHPRDTASFFRVVALNEAAKKLLAKSEQVSFLALDAMVQSRRAGAQVRGFAEVASQMRRWSTTLHERLAILRDTVRRIVLRTGAVAKEARTVACFERVGGKAGAPLRGMAKALERSRSELAEEWRALDMILSELDQLGMMSVVLSRTAVIEATTAAPELREQLGLVSRAFYENAEAVVLTLKTLATELT